jgi:hypothetical protein
MQNCGACRHYPMLLAFWYLSSMSVVGVLCHDYVIDRFDLDRCANDLRRQFIAHESLCPLCSLWQFLGRHLPVTRSGIASCDEVEERCVIATCDR